MLIAGKKVMTVELAKTIPGVASRGTLCSKIVPSMSIAHNSNTAASYISS
jgi:hypothetical protein